MIKNTKYLLLMFASIVVLVAISFAVSRTMRENFREITYLLSHPYHPIPTNPSSKPHGAVGLAASPQPSTLQNDILGSASSALAERQDDATESSSQKSHNVYSGPALYRNDEFGFEFTIPDGWEVEENLFRSPYSYFNLTFKSTEKKVGYMDAVMINVVKIGFVEMSYRGLKPDDKSITVDDITGVRYEYPFEGGDQINYILPRSKDVFLIGTWKDYEDVFNEVVASLKFISRH